MALALSDWAAALPMFWNVSRPMTPTIMNAAAISSASMVVMPLSPFDFFDL